MQCRFLFSVSFEIVDASFLHMFNVLQLVKLEYEYTALLLLPSLLALIPLKQDGLIININKNHFRRFAGFNGYFLNFRLTSAFFYLDLNVNQINKTLNIFVVIVHISG